MSGNQISGGRPTSVINNLTPPERTGASKNYGRGSTRGKSAHLQNFHYEVRSDMLARTHSSKDWLKLIRARFADNADNPPSKADPEENQRIYEEVRLPRLEAKQKKQIVRAAFDEMSRRSVGILHNDARDSLSYILRIVFPHGAETEQARKLEAIFSEARIPASMAETVVTPDQMRRTLNALLRQIDVESAVIDSIKVSFPEYQKSDRFVAKALDLLPVEALASERTKGQADGLRSWLDNPETRDNILRQVLKDILTRGDSYASFRV